MTSTLVLHILFASLTLILCCVAWIRPTKQIVPMFRFSSIISIASGAILALDPSFLTRTFCAKLGVYILVLVFTHYKLTSMIAYR